MDDDQQFCLRWNNHQSTLVAVFDTLLENNTLVDCTLAAEGKYLNAHKVVLSACSPYFESLLSKHFDKHPIVVLKDVKFQELKAMMDYMYRGEVNISQDQLGALLKAAESLQIKGLSDNKRGETERKPVLAAPVAPKSPPPAQSTLPKVQGLTIEQRNREDSREGSTSPGPRKKKRMRRKSEELDNHDASNSSESHSLPAAQTSALPAKMMMTTAADVPEPLENKSDILTRHKQQQQTDEMPQVPMIKEKLETHTEVILEPKSEYVDEMNEDSIEDLTLDDDDLSNMEQMDDQAGPSHGNAGEGSSQGFGGWHMGNQSQDEVFLAAQEAVGAHRDSQGTRPKKRTDLDKVKFPTISMRGIFDNPDQPDQDHLKRSKRIRKVKTFFEETITDKQPIRRKKNTVLSHYIHYHENKKGELVKTLRCKKCCGFVRLGQKKCNKCIVKATRKRLEKANAALFVDEQSFSPNSKIKKEIPSEFIPVSRIKSEYPTASQIYGNDHMKAPPLSKKTKPISLKTKKNTMSDQQNIYRRKFESELRKQKNKGSKSTDTKECEAAKSNEPKVVEDQFAGFDRNESNILDKNAEMETANESGTSAADELRFINCLNLLEPEASTSHVEIVHEDHENKNVPCEKNEEVMKVLFSEPYTEEVQENTDDL